jgi:large subunit ribosomal protein L3
MGSIGSGTTPGRVWKGKQMPGRMGGKMATNNGISVVQVDPGKNLMMVYGSVPGKKGNLVLVRRAN